MSPQPAHSFIPVTDVTSAEAWKILSDKPDAQLVDVRTAAEWMFVGQPDLSSLRKNVIAVSWKQFPGFELNPRFADELKAKGATPDTPLYFMCRSGGRSYDAAAHMLSLGYRHCYNISDGFEGKPDASGQRGKTSGWKAACLPWRQS